MSGPVTPEEWREKEMNGYEFTADMGEISGFGGGYEDTCRSMLKAGCEWFDTNLDAAPKFHGYEDIYGIITEDNDDAKALTEAVVGGAPDRDCTGAMHQAVVGHVFAVQRLGWDGYVAEMSKDDED